VAPILLIFLRINWPEFMHEQVLGLRTNLNNSEIRYKKLYFPDSGWWCVRTLPTLYVYATGHGWVRVWLYRSVVLDEMGDPTSPAERLAYFTQFERHFSGSIDFEEYMNVSQATEQTPTRWHAVATRVRSHSQGHANRRSGGVKWPPPEIHLGDQTWYFDPQIFWNEIFSGTHPHIVI